MSTLLSGSNYFSSKPSCWILISLVTVSGQKCFLNKHDVGKGDKVSVNATVDFNNVLAASRQT